MYGGRVIREGILEAHQWKEKYGNDWFVLNTDDKTPVKRSYFFNDDGSEKDKPFVSLYNTYDKTYSRGRYLVEYLGGRIFMVNPDKLEIKEEFKEKFECFKTAVNFFKDNFIGEYDQEESYMNILGTHMFTTIKFKVVDSKIFEPLRNINIFKGFDLDFKTGLKDGHTFMVTKSSEDDMVFTFFASVEEFDASPEEIMNACKSYNGIEKFKL